MLPLRNDVRTTLFLTCEWIILSRAGMLSLELPVSSELGANMRVELKPLHWESRFGCNNRPFSAPRISTGEIGERRTSGHAAASLHLYVMERGMSSLGPINERACGTRRASSNLLRGLSYEHTTEHSNRSALLCNRTDSRTRNGLLASRPVYDRQPSCGENRPPFTDGESF